MNSLKEEILKKINKTNPYPPSIDEGIDICIQEFEKRIASVKPASGMEYHCVAAVQYTKDKVKELLK